MSVIVTPLRCLIVEDSEDDALLMLRQLRTGGYDVTWERVDTPEAMRAALDRPPWDIVISDYKMPRFNGLAALKLVQASGLDLPFIIVSGTIGEDTAVEAMRQGAHDYLMKDRLVRLVPAVARELREADVRRERTRAETTLHLQSAALTAAANGIVITNGDGTIVWVNPAFTNLTGYTAAEAVGRNPRDLVKSGQQKREVYRQLWETILAGCVWTGELVNRRKDGSLYPEEQTITPVRDANGAIAHFIAIKQDLTERKQAEAAWRASEQKYRELVEHANSIILRWTRDGKITFLNEFGQKFFGYAEAEILGCHVVGTIVPASENDRQNLRGMMEQICAHPEAFEQNSNENMRRNGERVWVAWTNKVVLDEQGQVKEILSIGSDITARKRAEEELKKRNAFIETILANAPIGFAVNTISDGQSVLVSRNFERIYGVSPDSLHSVDEYFEKVYPDPVRRAKMRERVMADIASGEASRMRWENIPITTVAGEPRVITATNIPLPEQNLMISTVQDVTEAWQAKEALRLQSAALTAAANAIVIADRAGSVVWANPAFSSMTGYTVAEGTGENPPELVKADENDSDVCQNLWETILAGGVWSGELVNRRKDGSLYPEQQTITPVRDATGAITHFIAIKQDLTESRLVGQMMQVTRRQFQAVFEQAAVGIIIAEGTRGRLVNVNRRFCEMLGYPGEELRQLSSDDLTHPDDLAGDSEQLEQISLGMIRDSSREKRYRRKDGSYMWAKAFVAPLDPSEAKPNLWISVIEDITERRAGERLLREQNEILSNSHEGVMIVNLAGQITWWNHGAETMFGWSAAEALGRTPAQLVGDDDVGVVPTLLAAVERDGFWNGDLRMRTRDGRKLMVDCRTTLVRDEAGRPRARLSFLADITEKKLLEEKFLQVQRLESIGMLAAGIAHDLNNVLAPIVFAGPLLRGSLSTPRDLKIVDTLEQSAARGTGLVKQILGFARSTTGEFQATQVKHLVRDIVDVIEETFPKSIQLEHQIPSNLWPVEGNATQIHQVLMNLCVNARDAMPQGGTLRLVAANRRLDAAEAGAKPGARPGAWLMLEVGDTGTGIRPEVVERIWSPFFTTKAVGKGTGLGLSTVRGIVLSHHGFVELDTEVGRGSTFRVFLPAIETAAPRAGAAVSPEIPRGHGELILVVDDDAAIRGIVCQILELNGYRSLGCADGEEAIALFTAQPGEIPLVVTDVDMPRLGGVALAQALAQIDPGIRLLGMSGLSRSETGVSDIPAMQHLAHAFLLKPFKPEELLTTVHRLLQPSAQP